MVNHLYLSYSVSSSTGRSRGSLCRGSKSSAVMLASLLLSLEGWDLSAKQPASRWRCTNIMHYRLDKMTPSHKDGHLRLIGRTCPSQHPDPQAGGIRVLHTYLQWLWDHPCKMEPMPVIMSESQTLTAAYGHLAQHNGCSISCLD